MQTILTSSSSNSLNEALNCKIDKVLQTLERAFQELKSDKGHDENFNFIHRISVAVQPAESDHKISFLLKGYLVKKHTKSLPVSHKFIYISDDLRSLCWKSVEKNDQKKMDLKDIEEVAWGEESMNYLKSSTCQNLLHCIVIVGRERSLEIECASEEETAKVASEVRFASANAKKIRMSYRF